MKKAGILLADGFEEVEAITPADFLNRAGVSVVTIGIGGNEIKGSHGITIKTDTTIGRFSQDLDCIIIPGGMPGAKNVAASAEALKLVNKTFKDGKLVAAICAAPAVVLTKTDIIKNKKVTSFPGYEKNFPDSTYLEDRVVVDGNLITSRGAGTAAEFALKIIENLVSGEKADKIKSATLQKP
ncbi:MAG: DJ-1/PfpI family protein [Spirochaetales bacterium]|nr:DJ-1/PfpI family protein [Spirochaetales bacterium]